MLLMQVTKVILGDGRSLPTNLVVVGIGAKPSLGPFKGLLEEEKGGFKVNLHNSNLLTIIPKCSLGLSIQSKHCCFPGIQAPPLISGDPYNRAAGGCFLPNQRPRCVRRWRCSNISNEDVR